MRKYSGYLAVHFRLRHAAGAIALRKQRRLCEIRDEVARAGAAQSGAAGFRADDFALRLLAFPVEDQHRHDDFLDWRSRHGQNNPVAESQKLVGRHWAAKLRRLTTIPILRAGTITSRFHFVPRQNPFYIALPYNDVSHGQFKPEAPLVVPWFGRPWCSRAIRFAKIAGSRFATAAAFATRSGKIAGRSAPITVSTFSERAAEAEPESRRGARCLARGPRLSGPGPTVAERLAICRSSRRAARPVAKLWRQ